MASLTVHQIKLSTIELLCENLPSYCTVLDLTSSHLLPTTMIALPLNSPELWSLTNSSFVRWKDALSVILYTTIQPSGGSWCFIKSWNLVNNCYLQYILHFTFECVCVYVCSLLQSSTKLTIGHFIKDI